MPMTMPDNANTAPTERSMPPVTMTAVMPSAMIPTKAKLRVTLNRFCCVAKTSLDSDRTTKASAAATDTQNVGRLISQLSQLSYTCARIDSCSVVAMDFVPIRVNNPSDGHDCDGDQARHLFGRDVRDSLVRHVCYLSRH